MASDGSVTLVQMNDAIKGILEDATGISTAQSYDELTEGIAPGDMPLLQVYFESLEAEPGGMVPHTTFQGGVKTKSVMFHADIFCRQRSNIAEDMAKVLEIADAVIDVLETENTKPFFSQHGIKDFHWSADRVTFDYAGALYAGIRFYITVWAF